MIRLSKEKVLALHRMLTRETGGDPNLRDEALLDSALAGAFQTFGGQELYPTVEEKAARLGHSLIANHAFVDGNKRIGVLVLLCFSRLNGLQLSPAVEEVARMGLAVAAGQMDYAALLQWIRDNL